MAHKKIIKRNGTDYLYWVVKFKNEEGKPTSKSFSKKTDALRFENEQKKQAVKVSKLKAKRGTALEDIVTKFKEDSIEGRDGKTPWADQSIQKFDADVGRLYKVIPADTPVQKLTKTRCEEVRDHLTKSYSRSTAKDVFGRLKATLAYAERKETISKNPCHGLVIREDRKNRKRKILSIHTPAEVRTLINVTESSDHRYKFLPRLLHESGMRIGEARALRFERVDTEAKTLTICESVDRDSLEASDVKSYDSLRIIRISDVLAALLDEAESTARSEFVLSEADHVYSYRNLLRIYYQFQHKAKVPRKSFHMARHFCASRMVDAGCSELVLRHHLGHEDIETTLKIYGHLFEQRQAINDTPINLLTF